LVPGVKLGVEKKPFFEGDNSIRVAINPKSLFSSSVSSGSVISDVNTNDFFISGKNFVLD